jgi:molecular chaperone Hsp33
LAASGLAASKLAAAGAHGDLAQAFQIDVSGLRGRLVRLGASVDAILGRHDYPDPVARMLGEALALAAALAGGLKYDGVFTLQTKGDGAITMMVADVTSARDLRGYAQFDAARLARAAASGDIERSVPRLIGAGYLAFTVDQGAHTERYQGIVELTGATLADCVHHYFQQSEQIGTAVKLACGRTPAGWRAAALTVQQMPQDGGIARSLPPAPAPEADRSEFWRRAVTFMGSSTTAELLDSALAPDRLLYRLFHEDGVRVWPAQPLRERCRCTVGRVETVLRSLRPEELEDMKVDGAVIVTCQFCSTIRRYDERALQALFAG